MVVGPVSRTYRIFNINILKPAVRILNFLFLLCDEQTMICAKSFNMVSLGTQRKGFDAKKFLKNLVLLSL